MPREEFLKIFSCCAVGVIKCGEVILKTELYDFWNWSGFLEHECFGLKIIFWVLEDLIAKEDLIK